MDLCSNGHPEVCYDEQNCPVCSLNEEMGDEIADLEKEVADLQEELDSKGD